MQLKFASLVKGLVEKGAGHDKSLFSLLER